MQRKVILGSLYFLYTLLVFSFAYFLSRGPDHDLLDYAHACAEFEAHLGLPPYKPFADVEKCNKSIRLMNHMLTGEPVDVILHGEE